jgi:hypothetical protein
MVRRTAVEHRFVESAPDVLQEGVLYVSVNYKTALHNCLCGCGTEVVTPIRPTDWTLLFHGDSVSLYPSIGNWGLSCQSHYWIDHNQVRWSYALSREEIEEARAHDRFLKARYFGQEPASASKGREEPGGKTLGGCFSRFTKVR